MSMVNRQDIPKALALVGGIAAVFGFFFVKVQSVTGAAATSPFTVVAATPSRTLVASATDDDSVLDLPTLIMNGAKEPIRDVLPPVPARSVQTSFAPRRTIARPVPSSLFDGNHEPDPHLPDARNGSQPMGVESTSIVSTEPEVHVTGIVPGEYAYAVIKVGDKDHVVRQGETGDVEIVHTGETSVTVRQSGKTKTVTVGG